jgi:FkbM family methyltransferase
MKVSLLNSIYAIFKIRFMEYFLVWLLKISRSKTLVKFAPPNTHYKENDIRFCNRYGIEYKLDLNDYQSWLLYFFSDEDSSFGALNYLNNGDVCVDVGGNIGQTALMMAIKVGPQGKVFSFEPFERTHASFQNNLALNPHITNVKLERMAVGETSGELTMYVENKRNSGGNRIKPVDKNVNAEVQKVKVVSLDEYFLKDTSLTKVDLIKIDVEGFEMKVLKGAHELITKFRPALFVEINDANLRSQGDSLEGMLDFLTAKGYSIFDPQDGTELQRGAAAHFKGSDIYCKIKIG